MFGGPARWRIAVGYTVVVLGAVALVAGIAVTLSENAVPAVLLSLVALVPGSVAAAWFIVDRELRRLADDVEAMVGDLGAAHEERWACVQDLSHELRNPLAVMATTLDVAIGSDDGSPVELRRAALVARRSVDRVARTVDDLIDFARDETPEAGRARFDLAGLLEEVLAEHRGPLDAHRLVVERYLEPAVVIADREAVKRAIGNVVGNAVRLSRPGSVVRVGTGVHRGFAWVAVDDQGPGLDPAQHELVFRRFWSHDRASLNGEKRTGLGLAITRQIAEQHGGAATLRSELGGGAEFAIWIPQSPEADPTTLTTDGVHPAWSPLLGVTPPTTESFISA